MKVGDLVKWSGWKYPMLIVNVQNNIRRPIGGDLAVPEKYCLCWIGAPNKSFCGDGEYIDLFESDLEIVK